MRADVATLEQNHQSAVPLIRIRYDISLDVGSIMEKVCRICGEQERYLIRPGTFPSTQTVIEDLSLEAMMALLRKHGVGVESSTGFPTGRLTYENSDFEAPLKKEKTAA